MLSSKFIRNFVFLVIHQNQNRHYHHFINQNRIINSNLNCLTLGANKRINMSSSSAPASSPSSSTSVSGMKKNGDSNGHNSRIMNNNNNGESVPERHRHSNGNHNGSHHSKNDSTVPKTTIYDVPETSVGDQYSLEEIREQLRQCDPANSDGRLVLNMDDQTGIATLCISSPARKNAFSGFMMAQFSDLLDQLEQWTQGQMIILYGADNFFCSGADLKTIRHNKLPDQCGAHFISSLMHSNLTRLERLPLVSVALIEGKALGGGAEIITACDFRVALPDAQIGFVHARLGVTPGFGGGTRLLRLVGPTKALQLMLSARLIDADTARELGLVQHLLEPGVRGADAVRASIEWYRNNYGTITPAASRAIKTIVAGALQNISTDWALKREANIFCSVWGREEHMKALASNIKHHK